ncbi:hypothetical protein ACSJJE_00975, partial [Escherichia coli]
YETDLAHAHNAAMQAEAERLRLAKAEEKARKEAEAAEKAFQEAEQRRKEIEKEQAETERQLKRKRLVRTVLIFTESSDQLSRATDRVPGLPASPGYVQ